MENSKKYFWLFILMFFIWLWDKPCLYAQDLGVNTTSPHASAILDITSQTKGLLVPRMTLAERNLISNPVNALLIYQIDNKPGFYYYETSSTTWKLLSGTNSKIQDADGNTMIQTEESANENIIRFDINGIEKMTLTKNASSDYARLNIPNNQGNIFMGDSTANSVTNEGIKNIAFNVSSLKNNIVGDNNIAIGTSSLSLFNENNSIGIGYEALKSTVLGDYYNVGIGYRANFEGGGDATVILGSETAPNLDFYSNIAIGKWSNHNSTTGSQNIAIGSESIYNGTSLSSVTAIGYRAMYNNNILNYYSNRSIGAEAGNSGEDNLNLGYKSLSLNNSNQNVAFGSQALQNHLTGHYNQVIGYNSLADHVDGNNNISIGSNSLANNVNGVYNVSAGTRSLFSNLGSYNIGIGYEALSSNNNVSNYNVSIGSRSQADIATGDKNTAIGYNAKVGPGVTNSFVLGNNSYTDSSNVIILGSVEGINEANATVRVGLGTSSPHASSIFEAKATDKAFSLPIINNVSNPTEGLLGSDVENFIFYNNNNEWEDINDYDLYISENAAIGETFVVRNNEVIKGYPNAIQLGESIISKATVEQTENDNIFKLKLLDVDVMTMKNNVSGQLLVETPNNSKSILSGTYDINSSTESTLLTIHNNSSYDDGNTIAGDYVFYGTVGENIVGLGQAVVYNTDPTSPNDESIAVGFYAGYAMTGVGMTIIGNNIFEGGTQFKSYPLLIGNGIDADNGTLNSAGIGYNAKVNCINCLVIGNDAASGSPLSPESFVGIGITNPTSMLDIDGESTSEYPQIRLDIDNSSPIDLEFKNSSINKSCFFSANTHANNNNADFRFGYTSNGGMLILKGNGNAELVTLNQNSDSSLKKDLQILNKALEKIKNITPVSYLWKDQKRDNKKQIGLIAQHVNETIPELVSTDDNGFLALNYAGLNAVLWQSLKELNSKLENNNKSMQEQETKIMDLKRRIEALKSKNALSHNHTKI